MSSIKSLGLEKQILSIDFKGGLNQKISEQTLPADSLRKAENAIFEKQGELRKRLPFVSRGNAVPLDASGLTVTSGKAMSALDDEVIVFDGRRALSEASPGVWTNKGDVVPCTMTNAFLEPSDAVISTNAHIEIVNGFRIEAWSEVDLNDPQTLGVVLAVNSASGGAESDFVTDRVHGLSVGSHVLISSSSVGAYNQTSIVTSVPDSRAFRLGLAFSGTATADYSTVRWKNYARVIHESTGAIAVQKTQLGNAYNANPYRSASNSREASYDNPQLHTVAISGYVFILYFALDSSGSPVIQYQRIDTNSGISSSLNPSAVFTLGSVADIDPGKQHLEVCKVANSAVPNGVLVGWMVVNAGTRRFRLQYYAVSGGLLSPTGLPTADAFNGIAGINDGGFGMRWANQSRVCMSPIDSINRVHLMAGYFGNVLSVASVSSLGSDAVFETSADHGFVPGYETTVLHQGFGVVAYNGLLVVVDVLTPRKYRARTLFSGLNVSFTSTSTGTVAAYYINSAVFDSSLNFLGDANILSGEFVVNGHAVADDSSGIQVFYTGNFVHPVTLTGTTEKTYQQSRIATGNISSSGAITTPFTTFKHNCTMVSTVFAHNNDKYFACAYTSKNIADAAYSNGVLALVRTTGQTVAKSVTGAHPHTVCSNLDYKVEFLRYSPSGSSLPILEHQVQFQYSIQRVTNPQASRFVFGASRFSGLSNYGTENTYVASSSFVDISFAPARAFKTVQVGRSLLGASGILWHFDGTRFYENGFLTYPQIVNLNQVASAGYLDAGLHSYVAVYEWIDGNGDVHRSSPSSVAEITSVALDAIDVQVHTLPFSNRLYSGQSFSAAPPKIVLYKTGTNGSIFYRCAEAPMDITRDLQTIRDVTSSQSIISNEQLYTTGFVSVTDGNTEPASCTDIALHKGRLFVVDTDNNVRYSRPIAPSEQINFSGSSIISINKSGTQITAIGSVFDNLAIFTDRDGYYLTGDGPDRSGEVNPYAPPRIFAPNQGAIAGSPHVETQEGLFYRSERGYYLVSRSMDVSYIGALVEDYNSFPAQQMAVVDDRSEVRIALGGGSSNVILVYNYFFRQWSTFVLNQAAMGSTADILAIPGRFLRLNSAGIVQEETEGVAFQDVGASTSNVYARTVETSWLNTGSLQRLARVWRFMVLGDYISPHTLNVEVFFDYDDTVPAETHTVSASTGGEYLYRGHLKHQKSRSVLLRMYDSAQQTPYESSRLTGLALEVGLRSGTFKRPQVNTTT